MKQIHADSVTHESELASIDEAIITAAEKLRAAEEEHLHEEDRKEARIAREILHAELMENGLKLDEAMQIIVEESKKQKLIFDRLRNLGVGTPRPKIITGAGLRKRSASRRNRLQMPTPENTGKNRFLRRRYVACTDQYFTESVLKD